MIRAWTFWAVAVSSLGCLTATCVAWGATYNFYFNNVEQGPNSQASPSVSIQDGKLTGSEAAKTVPDPEPTATPAQVAEPSDTMPAKESEEGESRSVESGSSTATEVAEWRRTPQARKWRVEALGVAGIGWGDQATSLGLIGAVTWNPWPVFGVRAFGGGVRRTSFVPFVEAVNGSVYSTTFEGPSWLQPVFGAEVEWNPIRVNFWGLEDWFSMGVFAGASNLHVGPDEFLNPHAGIRARFNVTEALGLVAQTRFWNYATFEAGLSLGF